MKLLKWLFPGGGDDDKNQKPTEPEGPLAGNYSPTDPNTPIPGEGEAVNNSQLGG